MKTRRRGALVLGLGLSWPLVTLVGPPGAAPAAASTRQLIVCQSMVSVSPTLTAPVLVGDCNHPGVTGGSGQNFIIGPGPYPIDWSTGKTLSFTVTTRTFPSPSRCPDSEIEFDLVGTIATARGAWTKRYLGHTIAFDDCLTSSIAVAQIVPGTQLTIDP